MSGNYYKKVKPPPPPNSYGFKQVSSKELHDIMKRVTRRTYSAKLHTDDSRQLNNYEHLLSESGRRSVASACGRQTASSRISSATTDTGSVGKRQQRLTDREMSKLIRRLQRPTTATTLHSVGGYTDVDENSSVISRQRSAPSPSVLKSIAKLRRPTTATIAKDLNSCHLCYEHENKKKPEVLDAFDYDYSDDKVVPAEEIDFIVTRIAAPTYSSNKGNHSCMRMPMEIDEVKIRENLPLLSGLKRSKNIDEITKRLHPSRSERRPRFMIPQATPITSY